MMIIMMVAAQQGTAAKDPEMVQDQQALVGVEKLAGGAPQRRSLALRPDSLTKEEEPGGCSPSPQLERLRQHQQCTVRRPQAQTRPGETK